jgi:hypothetical protein
MAKDGVGMNTNMLAGLKTRCPPASDSSTTCKGGSVKDGATRSEIAPADKTIGPRVA